MTIWPPPGKPAAHYDKITTYNMVPGMDVEAGDQVWTSMPPHAKVMFVATSKEAAVYRRDQYSGDFVCVYKCRLGEQE